MVIDNLSLRQAARKIIHLEEKILSDKSYSGANIPTLFNNDDYSLSPWQSGEDGRGGEAEVAGEK